MPRELSRRRVVAGLGVLLAGCGGRETTDTATDTSLPSASPSASDRVTARDTPTDTDTDTETDSPADTLTVDDVRRLSVDDPRVAWAVALPESHVYRPAVAPDGRVAVAVSVSPGPAAGGTPTPPTDDGSYGAVYEFDPDGTPRWRFGTDRPVTARPAYAESDLRIVTGFSTGFAGRGQRVSRLSATGNRLWTSDPYGKWLRPTTTTTGWVYVATADDFPTTAPRERLTAYDPDGRRRWRVPVGDGTVAVTGQTVLHDSYGWLHAFDRTTGDRRWRRPVAPVARPDPVTVDGAVLVRTPDESVVSPTPTPDDGTPADDETTGGDRTPYSATAGRLASVPRSGVAAVDVRDGRLRWTFDPSPGDDGSSGLSRAVSTASVADSGSVAVVLGGSGTLYGLTSDGTVRWRRSGPATDGSLVATPTCVVTVADGTARFREPSSGRVLARRSVRPETTTLPATDGLLVGPRSEGRRLASFGPRGERRWRYTTVAPTSRPAVGPETVVVTVGETRVVALRRGG
ncbi:PQQ-binding-like beta-propeller repeat protein [Halobaculum sp. MBLA0147]|uniref:outer membrane protein assembly factor BamB family protein n=1 Tax=Halobaculum sp. MBLA0147 TaxID=3079934 RepID=UPI003524B305